MVGASSAEIEVDGTLFTFPDDWQVSKFDTWEQFTWLTGILSIQGCDLAALDGDSVWLIEVKDYTYTAAVLPEDLDTTVANKAIGTMAVLFAQARSSAESEASSFAAACQSANRIHMALHLNVRTGGQDANIRALLSPIQDKLKRVKKKLGIHKALVTTDQHPGSPAPWQARRDPATRQEHTDR